MWIGNMQQTVRGHAAGGSEIYDMRLKNMPQAA